MNLKVLRTVDGVAVFDGADVFRFMDSLGLPLALIVERCVFDWPTFAKAAAKSGNYSWNKLKQEIREAFLGHDEVSAEIIRKLE